MNKGFLVTTVIAFSICGTQAADTYTTSTGAVFTQVQGPGSFGQAWKDPGGTIWSTDQGKFENEAIEPDQNGVVVASQATEACARIGGKLPLLDDYKKLMSYFELNGNEFTEQGTNDLIAIFPGIQDDIWWTSSRSPNYSRDTAYFSADLGCTQLYDFRRDFSISVRCLARVSDF